MKLLNLSKLGILVAIGLSSLTLVSIPNPAEAQIRRATGILTRVANFAILPRAGGFFFPAFAPFRPAPRFIFPLFGLGLRRFSIDNFNFLGFVPFPFARTRALAPETEALVNPLPLDLDGDGLVDDALFAAHSTLLGTITVFPNVGDPYDLPITLEGNAIAGVFNKIDPTTGEEQLTGTFMTEMVRLDLHGELTLADGSVLPIDLQESPRQDSLGEMMVTDVGGGLFQIKSFFDIFTELSIDGGQTFIADSANPNGVPIDLEPIPEPSATLGLLLVGLGSAFGFKRKGNSKK